ncbi:hypothetical protein E4U11_007280 [Claviceps purpurea]|nr:hypothetical protein E4U11_007280 [Claviceps purpurea]
MSDKRCSAALKMEIQSQLEFYHEVDGKLVFNRTVMVIRGKDNEFFWATTKLRLSETSTLDLEKLDKIAVNLDLFTQTDCCEPPRPYPKTPT